MNAFLQFVADFGEMLKTEVSTVWTLRVFIKLCFMLDFEFA